MNCNSFFVDIYRNDFMEVEYCVFLGKGNISYGYCKCIDWFLFFSWVCYL